MSDDPKTGPQDGRILKCPKCQRFLKGVCAEGVELDFCHACKGIWVEYEKEKQILAIKPEVFSLDELRRLRKFYVPLGRIEKVRYVPCPVCGKLMNRKIWGSYSGVVVDVCIDHGVWYDDKELEKIREYVALGGIEYEKMVKMDQGFSEVHSKLVHEVTRLDVRVNSAYMRARLWSLVGF